MRIRVIGHAAYLLELVAERRIAREDDTHR
jgi:hypothetical protein